jgi:alpha-galactosidase
MRRHTAPGRAFGLLSARRRGTPEAEVGPAMIAERIDDGTQTLVLVSVHSRLPEVVYWGPPLPQGEDLGEIAAAAGRDLTGGMLDVLPPLSICPLPADGWQGQPGLVVADADGRPLFPRFRACRIEGGTVHARDPDLGLVYTATFAPDPATGVMTLGAEVAFDHPVRVHWLAAPVLPGPASGGILDLHGKWTRELSPVHTAWQPGVRMREARTGRSGHEHPPFAWFPDEGTTETQGEVRAFAYGWSGGHRMAAEELPDGRRQIQFGHAGGSWTAPATRFATAPLYVAWSDEGLNGVARCFQRRVRALSPAAPRPVHYCCWEAVYFDHDLETLAGIAEKAAALGVERFVLDDGWFGGETRGRDDDTTSLGDWGIDRRKWPSGLQPLIDRVHALGMTFGLWVEPEMVSPESDLFRAHPDWALGPADQILGRSQMVLDLGNPDVVAHLFAALDAILSAHAIDYLKWDHNRLLPLVDAAQTEGAYALLDRLRAAHPGVSIESCASGGGRIDWGILRRTTRVWLSDSNDALERARMQRDAALILPACLTGSHVGPRHSHTSGRSLPMSFRARVAAARHMGLELDPAEITPEEAEVLRAVIAWWKANRDWLMGADILRLPQDDPATVSELHLAADGDRFAVWSAQVEASRQILPRPLRLAGLEPQALYRVALANPKDAAPQTRGPCALRNRPLVLSGRHLMTAGLNLPIAWPATCWIVEGHRL